MKIRTGFVSNSSSSSFCLFGAWFDISDVVTDDKLEDFENDAYEFFDSLVADTPLEYCADLENNSIAIGIAPESISDDECLGSVRMRAKEEIDKLLTREKEYTISWEYGEIYN